MRFAPNGRGVHPTLRSSSLRSWFFDGDFSGQSIDYSKFGAARRDLKTLASANVPALIDGPIGAKSRRGDSVDLRILATNDASVDAATMISEFTLGFWFRVRSIGALQTLVRFGGPDDSALEVDNVGFSLQVTALGALQVSWEQGAGILVAHVFVFSPALWNTQKINIRRRDVGGGSMQVDLFVNSQLVETSPNLTAPTGASSALCRWSVLGAFTAALLATACADADVMSAAVYDTPLTQAEITEDHRRGTLLEFFPTVDLRVEVEDGNGNFIDLTDFDGVDWVNSVSYSESAQDGINTASIMLLREQRFLSSSILRTDSKLNLVDVDDVTSYDPLLQLTRAIKIYAAFIPIGQHANGLDWMLIFDGQIDAVDSGSEKTTISCRDKAGRLVDTHIEEEVINPAIQFPNQPQKQASYGTNAGEPQETVIQKILDDNDNDPANNTVTGLQVRNGSYDPLTLKVTSPSTTILKPYTQTRVPVFTAIRDIALLNGGDLKFLWSEEDQAFLLTLTIPQRDRVDSDLILQAQDIVAASKASLDVKNIRTAVRITYQNSETSTPTAGPIPVGSSDRFGWSSVDGQGGRLPAFYEVRNDDAIATFGRRFMELSESSSSQIDTLTEAQTLALAANTDLSEPDFEFFVDLPLMPHINVGDILRLENDTLFTATQRLAVVSVSHSFGDKAMTKIGMRGKPTLGFKRWLDLEQVPGQDRPSIMDPRLALFDVDRGPMLRILRQINDNSDARKYSKFINIPNGSFSDWFGGVENPPDNWSVSAGSWGLNLSRSQLSASGSSSVSISETAAIESDVFPINGEPRTPYSFEVTWQRLVVSADAVELDLDWIAADRTTIVGTQTLSIGVDFPAVATTASQWFRSRVDGIITPAIGTAKFLRITIRQTDNAVATAIIVDNISAYRSAYSAKVPFDATGFFAASPTIYRLIYTDGSFTAPNEWDPSAQIIDDTASPANNDGSYFECLENGRYDVKAVVVPTMAPNTGTSRSQLSLMKNATFDATGTMVTGTLLWSGTTTSANHSALNGADSVLSIFATVNLDEGDKLSVVALNIQSSGNLGWYPEPSKATNFEVTQRLTQ